jgi:hypothetical protein
VTETPLIHALAITSRTTPTFYVGITRNFSYFPAASGK